MMNKKGFTLVELLGVIILIVLIGSLSFPTILNHIKKSKDVTKSSAETIIIESAKNYVDDNINQFEKIDSNTYCISISTLIQEGYLDSTVIEENNELSNKTIEVVYSTEYKYKIKDTCTSQSIGYTFVEYIGCIQTDNNYRCGINTGVTFAQTKKAYIQMEFTSTPRYHPMILKSASPYIYAGASGFAGSNIALTLSQNYNKDQLTNNGFKSFTLSWNSQIAYNIEFGYWGDSSWSADWKFKRLKLYGTNNEIVRDFVPCYRNSDNVVGLYDNVEGQFYTNLGTGSFIIGND